MSRWGMGRYAGRVFRRNDSHGPLRYTVVTFVRVVRGMIVGILYDIMLCI